MNTISIFGITIFIASIILTLLNIQTQTFYKSSTNTAHKEIILTQDTPVLSDNGKLTTIGWSRSPAKFKFNPNKLNPSSSYLSMLNLFRYKKWEAFILIHSDFLLFFAIVDLSYIGGHVCHYSQFNSSEEIKLYQNLNIFNKPFILDDCSLDCFGKHITEDFIININKTLDKDLEIVTKMNNTDINFDLDIKVINNDIDKLVTLNPISEDSSSFYYNVKSYTMEVQGKIKVNGKEYNPEDILAVSDSGRGVWPISSGWVWISANGRTNDGNRIGLNFGYGFNHPNSTEHTEDSFVINGKIFKLNHIQYSKGLDTEERQLSDDIDIIAEPSEIIKNSCKIKFRLIKKKDNLENLYIAKIMFNIRYGKFIGECINSEGGKYTFEIYGVIENHSSIW